MSAPNLRDPIVKDNLTASDFESGGGWSRGQLQTFLDKLVAEPTLMKDNKIAFIDSPVFEYPTSDLTGLSLHPTSVDTALTTEQESKLTIDKVELRTREYAAAFPVTDDVYEDQILKGTFDTYMATRAVEKVSRDMETLGLLSDSDSQIAQYAGMDGLLVQAAESDLTIDYSASPVDIALAPFSAGLHALPPQYKSVKSDLRFYISDSTWESYTDYLSARNTILGDQYMSSEPGIKVPIKGVPLYVVNGMPDDTYLLTNKNNIVWGIQRKVTLEKERVAGKRKNIYHVTVRFDVKFLDLGGVVLFKGLKNFSLETE